MKENIIITLETGARYLLLHELNDIDGKNYFFAVGITDDDSLDEKETVFFEVTTENGEELVEKVDPESDLYKTLITIEYADSRLDEDPSFAPKLETLINVIEKQQTSSK